MKNAVQRHKTYRTRNGCVAFILFIDRVGVRPVEAKILTDGVSNKDAMKFGASHTRNYTRHGFEYLETTGEPQPESPFDLVEEIPSEPPVS
jgi:hypothetical protein